MRKATAWRIALFVRRHDGLSWAVCFNQRSDDKTLPDGAIDAALHRAAGRVGAWPEGTPLDEK